MAISLTACMAHVVNSEFAMTHIVAGLGGIAAASVAFMVKEVLNMIVGIPRAARGTILVKCTETSQLAVRTGNLI